MLQVPSKLRLNSSRLGDLSSAQYLVTGRRIVEMLKPPTANLILTNPDTNLSVICHDQVCVSRAPNWNKQPFANDRKMSWEGHSISVNHGRQITSFRKILPSRKRRKPPPPGMLACATPFSMLGANGDDLAKHMMVVLYWHDRPHSKYHHPRLAWRFSTDVTQSPSLASILLCWALRVYVMYSTCLGCLSLSNCKHVWLSFPGHPSPLTLHTLIGLTLRAMKIWKRFAENHIQ